MIRALTFSAVVIVTGGSAVGQELNIDPGQWQWSGDAELGPASFSDDGEYCITPADTNRSLDSLAAEIDPSCAVSEVSQDASITRFRLVCTGATKADALGEIDARGNAANLRLQGVLYPGTPIESDVQIAAKAVRRGAC